MNFKSFLALILIGLLLFGSYYLFSMEESQEEAKTTHSFEEILARLQAQDTAEAEQEADITINDEPIVETSQEDTHDSTNSLMESDVETQNQPTEDSCEQSMQEEN